jgi:hypothetical protein
MDCTEINFGGKIPSLRTSQIFTQGNEKIGKTSHITPHLLMTGRHFLRQGGNPFRPKVEGIDIADKVAESAIVIQAIPC